MLLEIGHIYKNKKNDDNYVLEGFAVNCTNSSDGEELVLYSKVGCKENLTFARNMKEFTEKFKEVL